MKRLNKKQIIIIISVAIVIIALAIAGIIFGINNGKKKETTKNDDKIESIETDETDEEEEETDETVRADDKSEEDTTTESETPEVEEPKPETPKTETPSNANQNQNQNNNNTGNNGGSNTGNSGGNTTTPSTPTPTPTPEPEKSPYAGMYKPYDSASVERFNQCATILRGGLAGQYIQVTTTFIDYFDGAIIISSGNTDNSWMYVKVKEWSTITGSEETDATYKQLPELTKQCLVTLAPNGGLELYNKLNSLILQYGDPRNIPTQGTISESIPGLSVTLTQGKAGIEIRFWAE